MWTLGVNGPPAGWHDTAACLVNDLGEVVALVEEERPSRRRHALYRNPINAVRRCLETAGIGPREVGAIAVGWDVPALYPGRVHDGTEFIRRLTGWSAGDCRAELVFVPHHRAHANSAYYASPYSSAGVLVVDGSGEDESISIWHYDSAGRKKREHIWGRHLSLGAAYDAATAWLGFGPLDAGKTMGLAAFGRARGSRRAELFHAEGEDLRLAVEFDHRQLQDLEGMPDMARYRYVVKAWHDFYRAAIGADGPSRPIDILNQDPTAVSVAFMAQCLVEDGTGWLADLTRKTTSVQELCIAGGVALNCSANGLLGGPVYIPPVPHDAGVALGAAWDLCPPTSRSTCLSPYLGSALGTDADAAGRHEGDGGYVRTAFDVNEVVELLCEGAIGGLAQGRAEVGPRALCHRSIVAIPESARVHRRVNEIKHREQWRPFGPVALRSTAQTLWEDQGHLPRYMLGSAVMSERGREIAPAVCHVDGTTRPQVIDDDSTLVVADILRALGRQGLESVLVNTSLNDRGQPIVDSADDAVKTFLNMDLDFIVVGDDLLKRRTGKSGVRTGSGTGTQE